MPNQRPMQWYDRFTAFANLTAGAITNHNLYTASIHGVRNIRGATLTRMIFEMHLRSDAVAQENNVNWGILIMNADARAAGAFPDPDDESDRAGWIVRGRLFSMQSDLSDYSQWTHRELDLRAQRIFRDEESELQLILKNNGSFVAEWAIYLRMLIRLP